LDPIPLFYGFTNTGESSQIAVLRQQSTKEFANYELYQDMMNLILPFLIAMLFIRYQQTKNKTMLILFILLSSLNIFALIATTEKAPAMFFILTMLVVYFIAQKGIRVKGIIIALILIIGINYLITFMKIAPNSEWVDSSSSSTDIDVPSESGPIDWPISSIKDKISRASQGLLERLIMGQTSGLYYYFEIFPQTHGFLKGMSIPNPLGLPYEYVNTSQYVYKIVYPDSPLNGTIPTVFFGDVYANFGYIVMLLSMVVVGFVMQLADIYFVRAIKTIVNTSFYSVLFLLFGKLGITTFFSAVFNTGTIALALLYLVLKYLNNEKVEIRNLWGRPSVMREVEPS
jgi:hypothetical protein